GCEPCRLCCRRGWLAAMRGHPPRYFRPPLRRAPSAAACSRHNAREYNRPSVWRPVRLPNRHLGLVRPALVQVLRAERHPAGTDEGIACRLEDGWHILLQAAQSPPMRRYRGKRHRRRLPRPSRLRYVLTIEEEKRWKRAP